MNCFNFNPYHVKPWSRGIPLLGIEGVELGPYNLVPLNEECRSDPLRLLSKMTFDGLLVDADLANGEISPRDSGSTHSLIRVTIEIGPSPSVGLCTGGGGVSVLAVERNVKLDQVVSQEFHLNGRGTNWTANVAILVSLPSTGDVSLQWTTQRFDTRWFRRKRVLTDHKASLFMKNGMPIFAQHL